MQQSKAKRTPTQTEQIIYEMITENTGTHFLDSGGDDGRHWQRHQGKSIDDFFNAPIATFDDFGFKYGELSVTLDLFHFLIERLEYVPELNASPPQYGMDSVEQWVSDRAQSLGIEPHGIYCLYEPFWVNTYNHPSLLSQVIQFYYWTEDLPESNGDYQTLVALQIHGGADVRGGYTDPKIFRLLDDTLLLYDAMAAIECSACGASWQTDDAYHWYYDGVCGSSKGEQLDAYETVILNDDGRTQEPTEGKLVFHPKHGPSCPQCIKGKLYPTR